MLQPASLIADNKRAVIIAATCAATVLATLFCAARIYTSSLILRRMKLDDYLLLLSVVVAWSSAAFSSLGVQSGTGKHLATLTKEQESNAILWTTAGLCLGILSSAVPKLAVVSLLTRVFSPYRKHNIFLWFLATFCLLSQLGCMLLLFGRGIPARSLSNFDVIRDRCFPVSVLVSYAIYAGVLSASVDVYLAVYPAAAFLTTWMSWRKKLVLSAVLGLGLVAAGIAAYRTTLLPTLASKDFPYDVSDLVVWTAIEGATTIIAACIPVLRALGNDVTSRRGDLNDLPVLLRSM